MAFGRKKGGGAPLGNKNAAGPRSGANKGYGSGFGLGLLGGGSIIAGYHAGRNKTLKGLVKSRRGATAAGVLQGAAVGAAIAAATASGGIGLAAGGALLVGGGSNIAHRVAARYGKKYAHTAPVNKYFPKKR